MQNVGPILALEISSKAALTNLYDKGHKGAPWAVTPHGSTLTLVLWKFMWFLEKFYQIDQDWS